MRESEGRADDGNPPYLATEVVFSLVDGFVWASWPGTGRKMQLGACDGVAAMMRDFLAQCEVGERLLSLGRGDS